MRATWAAMPIQRKLELLRATRGCVHAAAAHWVARAGEIKQLRRSSSYIGEEWISGPWAVLYAINRYIRTMRAIATCGQPALPGAPVRHDRAGNAIVRVFPVDLADRVLLAGITADVYLRSSQPQFVAPPAQTERVAILGAGNITSIPLLDALYFLIAYNAVCTIKLNPIMDPLRSIFEDAFRPLIETGAVAFLSGGADVGAALCADPAIDRIHLTGSRATYDALKHSAGDKPVTAELGNVTPTIVVPGEWMSRDLRFQAEHIVTQKRHNAGFNCIAAQVLILPEKWPFTDRLIHEMENVMQTLEPRPDYYPGTADRRAQFTQSPSSIVWLSAQSPSPAFDREAFCNTLFGVRLPGDACEFLHRAVDFANDTLSGTLGANVIVDPRTDAEMQDDIGHALEQLRYGCVGVNAWAGVGYFLAETPWGDYGGSTGFVHNAYLLANTEKSVVRAPFRPLIKPPWFVTNKQQARIGSWLCAFEARKFLRRLRYHRRDADGPKAGGP